jgi:hypothetical protein
MRPLQISVNTLVRIRNEGCLAPSSQHIAVLRLFARPVCVLAPGRAYSLLRRWGLRDGCVGICSVVYYWINPSLSESEGYAKCCPCYFVWEAMTILQAKPCCPSLGDLGSLRISKKPQEMPDCRSGYDQEASPASVRELSHNKKKSP